jgi:hypothetical protein
MGRQNTRNPKIGPKDGKDDSAPVKVMYMRSPVIYSRSTLEY